MTDIQLSRLNSIVHTFFKLECVITSIRGIHLRCTLVGDFLCSFQQLHVCSNQHLGHQHENVLVKFSVFHLAETRINSEFRQAQLLTHHADLFKSAADHAIAFSSPGRFLRYQTLKVCIRATFF